MAETVFILGAGASKGCGAPLMLEFLDEARRLWARPDLSSNDHFRTVFKTIGQLQQVHSKAQLDIVNVESVFAALDMGYLLRKFPGFETADEIAKAIESFKHVIVETIESNVKVHRNDRGVFWVPGEYHDFSNLVHGLLKRQREKCPVAIVTFNYDIALDLALCAKQAVIDYCFGDAEDSHPGEVKVMKLHGSLNWRQCPECGQVLPWQIASALSSSHNPAQRFREDEFRVRFGEHFRVLPGHCDKPVPPVPFLVPPTWNKGLQYTAISAVWANAAAELGEAENIYVIGYSLPESDSFFRYLYALGAVGDSPLQRFWVFNPDARVEERFRSLLGPGALARFRFFPVVFGDAIRELSGSRSSSAVVY